MIIVLQITRLFLHSQIDMSLLRAVICWVLSAPEIWISVISMEIKQKGTLFIFILRWEWRQAFAAVFSVHCQERRVHPILALSVILITWMPFASIGHLHILYTVQVHAALGQLWLYCKLHINSLARTFMLDWRSRAHCPMRPLYVKKGHFVHRLVHSAW